MEIIKSIFFIILALIITFIIQKIITSIFIPNLITLSDEANLFKKTSNKYSIKIIEGIMPLNSTEVFITTKDPSDANYVKIPKSVNEKNGSQFSFSFWLNKGIDINKKSFSNKIILLFGLKNTENLITKLPNNIETNLHINDNVSLDSQFDTILESKIENETINYPALNPNDKNYRSFNIDTNNVVVIKCPLIKFGLDGESIEIEFNTNNKIDNKFIINSNVLNTLDQNTWSMLTFTFEDYTNITGFATGLKMIFYINDKQISTQIIKDQSIKLNEGHIYILPNLNKENKYTNKGSIADVTYFNKAIRGNEIKDLVIKQFSDSVYKTPIMKQKQTLNKKYTAISLYNETYDL